MSITISGSRAEKDRRSEIFRENAVAFYSGYDVRSSLRGGKKTTGNKIGYETRFQSNQLPLLSCLVILSLIF